MDESWRIPIGSVLPRRRSADQPHAPHPPESLELDDFRDVFGGPPRSVVLRRSSGELAAYNNTSSRSTSFYEEIFRPSEYGMAPCTEKRGRRSPGFRVPDAVAAAAGGGGGGGSGILRMEEGFYDDIFGSDGGDQVSSTRSKSKSSSSMRSSGERTPTRRRAALAEDSGLASFASRLRPITIPSRRQNSSPQSTLSGEELKGGWQIANSPYFMDFQDNGKTSYNHNGTNDLFRQQKSHIGFSCCFSPPETISLEPSFRRSHKVSEGNHFDMDSPSSSNSSAFFDSLANKTGPSERWLQVERELEKVEVEVEEDEPIERSFVIDIGRHCMGENGGEAALEEAIAWAKETFRNQTSEEFELEHE